MCSVCAGIPAAPTCVGFVDPTRAVILETENGDTGATFATATTLTLDDHAIGEAGRGDTDMYAVVLTAGETYTINYAGLGSPDLAHGDPSLVIHGPDRSPIVTVDNVVSNGETISNTAFTTFTAQTSGTYYFELGSADQQMIGGNYYFEVRETEIGDSAADPALLYDGITMGGTLDAGVTGGDDDWYLTFAQQDFAYTFTVTGYGLSGGANQDITIELFDGDGNSLGITGTNTIRYEATSNAPVYVSVSGADPASTGSYLLSTTAENNTPDPSLNFTELETSEPLTPLYWGYRAPTVINVFFVPDGAAVSGLFNAQAIGWTAAEQSAAMSVFANFAAVTNVSFNLVTDLSQADFVMTKSAVNDYAGIFLAGEREITIDGVTQTVDGVGNFSSLVLDSLGTTVGGSGYELLLHEIGHGMGLAHPHDRGGISTVMAGVESDFFDYGTHGLNQGIYTVMTYNSGWHERDEPISHEFGTSGSLMALDIAMLQLIYGANTTTNSGNDTYALPEANQIGTYYSTIWDTGGVDEITYGGSDDAVINLNAATLQNATGGGGYMSHAGEIQGGYSIANGVVIENASGGSGNDTITGNAAHNRLSGNAGNDTISGGAGNDVIEGGAGGDTLDGGAGFDTLLYAASNEGVTVTLNHGAAASVSGGHASGDSATGFENVIGSVHADTLTGDTAANLLSGGGGNDRIFGGGGNDTLSGGEGFDALYGGAGDDTIDGGARGDLIGGGAGADTLDGGDGYDTLVYVGSDAGVRVWLGGNQVSGGHAEGDTITSFENVMGSGHDDRLIGSYQVNRIEGGAGDDVIAGYNGNDTLLGGDGRDIIYGNNDDDRLVGGAGRDILYGGADNDVFVYESLADNGLLFADRDRIQDFVHGEDRIDLSAIDADTGAGGDQAFAFTGRFFTGEAGQVRAYEWGGLTFIEGDVDGDRAADFRIELLGTGLGLDASDFVL